ncbi:uncharacterized protein LOC135220655 [Macrobrachium nipponense]|uniref:uncharacterized protein LOC135220655 n=1 Tax=Macrobrachium nipponense TaxID=159736 RepID=UPI0030C8B92A
MLLDSIQQLEPKKTLTTMDALQPLLLAEALTDRGSYSSYIYTRELKEAAADLKKREDNTVRLADKTASFMLISNSEYFEKLNAIFPDVSKFDRLTRNPMEDIKRDANRVITAVNAPTNATHLPPIQGDYSLSYLYGNVKTHKEGNPLCPIISQTPALTYYFTKCLDKILTPYIPSRYCLTSSVEFLEKICDSSSAGTMASLDVEYLFTNVPVDETIGIIMEQIYMRPPNIPEDSLKTLLDICTKRAPFTTHRGQRHRQKDGVAMGSHLGVLFANFCRLAICLNTDVPQIRKLYR